MKKIKIPTNSIFTNLRLFNYDNSKTKIATTRTDIKLPKGLFTPRDNGFFFGCKVGCRIVLECVCFQIFLILNNIEES